MAVFSTQQVRHFYVAKAEETAANLNKYAKGMYTPQGGSTALVYPDATMKGTMALVKIDDFDHSAAHPTSGRNMAEGFRFMYVNPKGEIMSSDLIWRQSIRSIKLTKEADLETKLPEWEITFSQPSGLTTNMQAGDGNVYYIDFRFPAFQNATDEEVMTKTVSFVWKSGHNWADDAAAAINKAFKEAHNLYNKLIVASAASSTKVNVYAPAGKWIRGIHSNKPNQVFISDPEVEILNDNSLNTIPGSNAYRVKTCGTSADVTVNGTHTVRNSANIADLEWFCMGERADTFRYAGWPNYVATEYMVDGTDPNGYDVLDIHFYFQGEGFVDDKSEKQLTIVAPAAGGNNVNEILKNFYDEICGNSTESNSNDTPRADASENDNQGGGGTDNQGGGGTEGGN